MDYGHAEVAAVFGSDPRKYSLLTTEFKGEDGVLKSLVTVDVKVNGPNIEKIPGSEKVSSALPSLLHLPLIRFILLCHVGVACRSSYTRHGVRVARGYS